MSEGREGNVLANLFHYVDFLHSLRLGYVNF